MQRRITSKIENSKYAFYAHNTNAHSGKTDALTMFLPDVIPVFDVICSNVHSFNLFPIWLCFSCLFMLEKGFDVSIVGSNVGF